jgi:hypothetical protein
MYTYNVSSCLSTWTVTAFTVERFIVVYFPLHRAAMCTFKNTVIILLCLIPIPLFFYSPVFFQYKIDNRGLCVIETLLFKNWLRFLDVVVANFFPLIVILTLNGLIVYRIWKRHRYSKNSKRLRVHRSSIVQRSNSTSSNTSSSSVSRPLIIVSTTFAILNLPSYAIRTRVRFTIHCIQAGPDHECWGPLGLMY